jgi:hypothetical protein
MACIASRDGNFQRPCVQRVHSRNVMAGGAGLVRVHPAFVPEGPRRITPPPFRQDGSVRDSDCSRKFGIEIYACRRFGGC